MGIQIVIDKALENGIHPKPGMPNTQFLRKCKNMLPTERRGRPLVNPTYPLAESHPLVMNWPFPHFRRGERENVFLCEENELYAVGAGGTTATLIDTYDAHTGTVECAYGGDFAEGSHWTLMASWAVTGGKLVATASPSTDSASQVEGAQLHALVVGRRYSVTYTLTVSAGAVRVLLGTAAGTARSAAGTYTETITCAGNTTIFFEAFYEAVWPFTGTIDDLSVVELDAPADIGVECIQNGRFDTVAHWTLGAGWSWSGQQLVATTLLDGVALQGAADQKHPLVVGKWYRVTYEIIERTEGKIHACVGSAGIGSAESSTGFHTETIECAGSTDFFFKSDTMSFTGVIDNVSVVELPDKNIWHLAPFRDMYVFTNGNSLVYSLPANPGGRTLVSTGADLAVASVCNHGNKLVLAGLSGTTFATSRWQTIFDAWLRSDQGGDVREDIVTSLDDFDAGFEDWVFISRRGGGAIDYPFTTVMAALGLPDEATWTKLAETIVTDIEQGVMQLVRTKEAGDIQVVLPLGNDFVCYGSRAVSLLRATEGGYVEDVQYRVGVPSRGAAWGDDSEHFFVDNNGLLCRYVVGKGIEVLDYSEAVQTLTAANLAISLDSTERYWWIADGVDCFCYTRTGMGQSSAIIPSSVIRLPSTLALVGTAIVAVEPWHVEVESEIFDAGVVGLVQTTGVRFATEESDVSTWQASLLWRTRKGDPYSQTIAAAPDARGIARIKQAGRQFAVNGTNGVNSNSELSLERIEVNVEKLATTKMALGTLLE